jgi:hypothetical protein
MKLKCSFLLAITQKTSLLFGETLGDTLNVRRRVARTSVWKHTLRVSLRNTVETLASRTAESVKWMTMHWLTGVRFPPGSIIIISASTSVPTVRPTQPQIQWIPGDHFTGESQQTPIQCRIIARRN